MTTIRIICDSSSENLKFSPTIYYYYSITVHQDTYVKMVKCPTESGTLETNVIVRNDSNNLC